MRDGARHAGAGSTAARLALRRRLLGLLTAVLGGVAFFAGMSGFHEVWSADPGTTWSWTDLVYATLRLFIFEGDAPAAPPPSLDLARFLAPLVAASSAVLASLAVFRDRWDSWRLKRAQGHVVICGGGALGEHLARSALHRGERVVVVDPQPDAHEVLRARGAWTVAGDATDPQVLAEARVAQARTLVAVCGDDQLNVAVALAAQQLAGAAEDARLRIHPLITDPELADLLGRRLTSERDAPIRVFDAYAMAARRFLAAHPLERDLTGPEDPRQVHLLIFGCGRMGQRLALAALRLGHYANGRGLRLTIVDRDASALGHGIQWRYPEIARSDAVSLVDGDLFDPEVQARVCEGAEAELRTYAVCFDTDGAAVTAALRLKELLSDQPSARLAVRLSDDGQLGGLIADSPRVVILGTHARALDLAELRDEGLDEQARAIHEDYLERRRAESPGAGPDEDPSLKPWAELSPDLRDANRHQADHIAVKLRAIGARVVDGTGPALALSDAEVELLAQMEHARWATERRLAGWTDGPKDNAAKTTPYLVGWEALDERTRDYDRDAVRHIPALLARVGRHAARA